MFELIYSLVIFIATLIGTLTGLGGGVFIKPILDFIGHHDVSNVAFFSAVAVFFMGLTAVIKFISQGTKIKFKFAFFTSLGAIIGGLLGNELFNYILSMFNKEFMKGIQSLLLALFLIFVLIFMKYKHFFKLFSFKHSSIVFFLAIVLGLTAAFLGIGGGPINVVFLMIFFSLSLKEAAVYSVFVILFSQASKLASIFLANQFLPYDSSFLLFIVPASILGGYLGAKFNKLFTSQKIQFYFNLSLVFIILINFYNAFTSFF